jgi:TolA-binding protein
MIGCPTELELTRAISENPSTELEVHLESCAACRSTWEQTVEAIEIARRIPFRLPSSDRREELRTSILAASSLRERPDVPSTRRRAWGIGTGALAAAAVITLVIARRGAEPSPAHAHGAIRALVAGTDFSTASTGPDEVVEMREGTVDVEVSPLHRGERFRVITADTEIEVHGTAFVVTAHAGHLLDVSVRHGLVEVRPNGGTATMLRAGQSWSAPVRTAITPAPPPPEPPSPAPTFAAVPASPERSAHGRAQPSEATVAAPRPVPRAAPERRSQDLAYDEGWAAMRAGSFEQAANAFARAGILDPEGPLAEDAGYFYAVALARAKRAEATTAFRDFLDRYPRSARARQAGTMLGWILLEANQRAEAERLFRAALDDPDPAVHASAKAGLAAVSAR